MDNSLLLLFGAITSVIVELYKWLVGKFGRTAANNEILFGVFGLSILWVVLTQQAIITKEAIDQIVMIILSAVGIYKVVIQYLKTFLPLSSDKIPSAPSDNDGMSK